MISYLTSWRFNVVHAGAHRVQVDAERDWRLWVGIDTGAVVDDLSDVDPPVSDCSTRSSWKETDGIYRATFNCPDFVLRGRYYPGLNSTDGYWVIWSEEDRFREVTFHRD